MEMEGSLVQPPMMMVNLIGHCSICLRKIKRMMTSTGDTGLTTTTPSPAKGGGEEDDKYNREGYLEEEEDPVPEGRLPAELTSFRHIWAYLVGKGKVEEVAKAKFVCSGGDEDDYGPGGMPLVVTELPPICEACGEKVSQLDRLHRELEAKVREIWNVIKDAASGGGGGAPNWRRQGFGELLRNSKLEAGTILDTVHFLGLLYGVVSGMETEDPGSGTFDSPKSQPLNDEDISIGDGDVELERDDWKLRAAPVVSIAPVSLPITPPEVETEEDESQTRRGVKRRRGPVRKAKVPFLPPEELLEMEYNWDRILDRDVKQEIVEPLEDNNEDDDPEMSMQPSPLLLDPADYEAPASSDHDKDYSPNKECDVVAVPDAPKRPKSKIGRKWGRRRMTPKRRKPKPAAQPPQTICEICNAAMPLPDIYEHMRTHVGDFAVKCPNTKCVAAFSNPRTMSRVHLRNHRNKACRKAADKVDIVCETCGVRYNSPGGAIALRAHLELHETATKNVSCPIQGCEERFTVRQSVYAHVYRKHLSPKTAQKCTLCRFFQDVQEMDTHLKDQHQIENPIKCRQCSFIFPDWESLLYHLYEHQSEGVPCYICTTGAKFQNIAKLQRHYSKEHQIGKLIVCDLCGKQYTCMDTLKSHIRLHHEGQQRTKVKSFKCDLCEEGTTAAYTNEQDLVSHKIKVHGAEPFACDVCHATFTTRKELNWHVRDRDPQDAERGICTKSVKREYTCDVDNCSVIYHSWKGLDHHKRRDHGILRPNAKQYICEFCSKEFLRSTNLLNHRKKVHLRIREECMCDICGENFVSSFNLKRHKLIHDNQRPHECHICGQTFRQKGVLDTHLKSHETLGDQFKPNGPIERTKRFKREPKP